MKILHWFFGIISGHTGINWLSVRYFRYCESIREQRAINYLASHTGQHEIFEVSGAGRLLLSNSLTQRCGNSNGFHVGTEWSRYPFIGGVIDKQEAKRLAEFILLKCNEAENNR